jgi:NADPH-dependent 2,4-dienoyl-CoA reductase/sulfur reductase-like enzyme
LKHSEIIIIGSSFAGVSSALTARQLYPNKRVLIIEKEGSIGHIPSSLNLLLKEEFKHLSDKTFVNEEQLEASGVELLLNNEVLDIDLANKSLIVEDENTHESYRYDKLILAMGSSPISERISGSNHPKVLTTKTLEASKKALQQIEGSDRILIAGGGQIGLEAADAFNQVAKNVTLVEASDQLAFKYFDSDMTQLLEQKIQESGVHVIKGHYVESIHSQDTELNVVLSQDLELLTDHVMLAVNFRPNTKLIEDQVQCHLDKTIEVDEYLETSVPDVFAVGDLIRTPYSHTETDYYLPLVNHAYISGKIAAMNLYQKTTSVPQSLRVTGSKLFGLYMVSVGLTEQEAALFYPIEMTILEKETTKENLSQITVKLITKKESGQLIGAQVYSQSDILPLADLLAISINTQMTDEALAIQDRLFYSGDFSISECIYACALKSYQKRLSGVISDGD